MSEFTYDWPASGELPTLPQILERAAHELRAAEATLMSDWQPNQAPAQVRAVNEARGLARRAAELLDEAALL